MHSGASSRVYVGAVVTLALLALAVPARWQPFAPWLADKADLAVAPVSRPVLQLAHWLRGARTAPDDDAVRVLNEDNEKLRQQLLATVQENQRLLKMVDDLQRGLSLNPHARARRLIAPVFGVTAQAPAMLRVQAGADQGVTTNSIALAPGLQLVGRVLDVSPHAASVLPIISRGAPPVAGVVIIDPTSPDGLRCTLTPEGDGTLRGPVEDRRDAGDALRPRAGQRVRLDDPTWPRAARMVLVGEVEKVEPSPDQPLRAIITVRPTVDQMDRLSEVILWVPEDEP